jgi:molecular chaperone GrpE
VNRDPDRPRPEENAEETEQGDDEGDSQLDLPLDALLDWGTDPGKLDKELAAVLETQSSEAIVAAERDEYLDALRRLQADFDNFRKRSLRQQTELLEHATEGLCVRLLPVLDALDLATEHLRKQAAQDDTGKALEQIDSLLRDVLAREGIERIDAVGVPFDPTVHDAVGHVPTEPSPGPQAGPGVNSAPAEDALETTSADPVGRAGAGGPTRTPKPSTKHAQRPPRAVKAPAPPAGPTVAQVMRAGYKMKSKVLRPAMVMVGD